MGVDVMRIETENLGQNDTEQEFILWLYQEFYRLMFYTAQKYVADQKQQEDIVQESLRKLIEKTSRLRRFQRPVLASYIVSTVRNTSIDYLKMWREEKERLVNLDDLTTQEDENNQSMDETLILQEEMDLLKKFGPGWMPKQEWSLKENIFWGMIMKSSVSCWDAALPACE